MNNDEVSLTALFVMQGILIAAKNAKYADLVPEELAFDCHSILSSTDEGRNCLRQVDSYWGRKLLALKEKLLMPGITLHYVLRKRFIEEYITNSINQGAKQIINLGAGFDTLLYRLAKKHPKVQFIEVDHPASQEKKLMAITEASFDVQSVNSLGICFENDNLQEKLKHSTFFAPDLYTVYILEGVLMYLSRQNVEELFQSLTTLSGKDHKVIFTAAEPFSANPKSSSLLFKMYLALKGEPLAWSCKRDQLNVFLQLLNYKAKEIIGATEFKQQYLDANFTGDLPAVEYIAVAEPQLM